MHREKEIEEEGVGTQGKGDGRVEIERMETGRHRCRETELQDLERQGESERVRGEHLVCYTEWGTGLAFSSC